MLESSSAVTVHRVSTILTFDLDDFKRDAGFSVVHPAEVK
jgi:hypothetical protein